MQRALNKDSCKNCAQECHGVRGKFQGQQDETREEKKNSFAPPIKIFFSHIFVLRDFCSVKYIFRRNTHMTELR